MKTRLTILLAALAAACTTKNNSALQITKVVPPTVATATGSTTTTCTIEPGGTEVSFLAVNPAENTGTVGAIVENQALPNLQVNPLLRVDASSFLPHQAVITYEVIGGGASIGQQTVPTAGVVVPGGGTGAIAIQMLPKGSVPAGLAAGTFIRTTFHIEGKMVDGSSVHTSEREYLFQICTTTGCAGNSCL